MSSRADNILHRVALGSIGVGLAVLGLKLVAWRLTGSVALYSDAMESIVNVAAAIAAYLAIRIGSRPPDRRHPYGHTKVEYFSAVFVGVLIVLAALSIAREAYVAVWSPKILEAPLPASPSMFWLASSTRCGAGGSSPRPRAWIAGAGRGRETLAVRRRLFARRARGRGACHRHWLGFA